MGFPGPLVWNRTLRRSFLLYPNSVGQNFTSKNDGWEIVADFATCSFSSILDLLLRATASVKPETPPNSPTRDFEENFAFFDDGYLSPESDQEIPAGPQRRSRDMFDEAAGNSYLEGKSIVRIRSQNLGHYYSDWLLTKFKIFKQILGMFSVVRQASSADSIPTHFRLWPTDIKLPVHWYIFRTSRTFWCFCHCHWSRTI